MEKLFENNKEVRDFIINLNRRFFLDKEEHIKKYYKARKIHEEVLNSMINYMDREKVPLEEYFKTIAEDIQKETGLLQISIGNETPDEAIIFNELFMYKNHKKIPSLTEIYIDIKKLKEKEKVKMLNAMKDSIVGLFKIIDCDHSSGYVTYEDVFTGKKYKVIDISMSSCEMINKDREIYIYNRIISYDGISFGTGIPIAFSGENKKLKEFIKKYKNKECSDFSKCLLLYDISKNSANRITTMNYVDY